MYQVIGFQKRHLTFKDGNSVDGYYLYLTQQREGVQGYLTESVFISDAKLSAAGYTPGLSDRINIYYNRYGKVEMISKVA